MLTTTPSLSHLTSLELLTQSTTTGRSQAVASHELMDVVQLDHDFMAVLHRASTVIQRWFRATMERRRRELAEHEHGVAALLNANRVKWLMESRQIARDAADALAKKRRAKKMAVVATVGLSKAMPVESPKAKPVESPKAKPVGPSDSKAKSVGPSEAMPLESPKVKPVELYAKTPNKKRTTSREDSANVSVPVQALKKVDMDAPNTVVTESHVTCNTTAVESKDEAAQSLDDPAVVASKSAVLSSKISCDTTEDTPVSIDTSAMACASNRPDEQAAKSMTEKQNLAPATLCFADRKCDSLALVDSVHDGNVNVMRATMPESTTDLVSTNEKCQATLGISQSICVPPSSSSSIHVSFAPSSDHTMHTLKSDADDTDKRIHRIMAYLKSAEKETGSSVDSHSTSASVSATSGLGLPFDMETANDSDNASATTETLVAAMKSRLMGQQMEIDEKTRTLVLIKKELKRSREAHEALVLQHQKDIKSKLALQRKEYEQIIGRHLAFIDKVLAEKQDMSKRCEVLADECKTLEKQFKDKSEHQEEAHARELKQKKDTWESAEKLKRDKWIQEKTKVIKEQTVKGLEPEIQRLIAQHKAQQKRSEEKYKQDLARERDTLIEQHHAQLDQFRDKLAAERRRAAEEERDFARQRYQKQLERDEMEFQQQKRKLLIGFEEQKEHLVQSLKSEKEAEEKSWRKLMDDLKHQLEAQRLHNTECVATVKRQSASEVGG